MVKQEACLKCRCLAPPGKFPSGTVPATLQPMVCLPTGRDDSNSLVVPRAEVCYDAMKRRLFTFLCALFAANLLVVCGFRSEASAAPARQTLSLDAAIELALKSHPSEAQARANVDVASARVVESRSQRSAER